MNLRVEGSPGRSRVRRCAVLLVCAGVALSLSSAAGTRATHYRREMHESAARRAALNTFRGLPLGFVQSTGQLDHRVRYSARAGNASVFLTRREAVLALGEGRRGFALRLAFVGANADPTIAGEGRLPGRVNYLLGNDPARWQQNLPTYEAVVYHNLWPGIDMAIRGTGGQLKYEFRVAPGADPSQIRLSYRGQERLALDRSGALRIETGLGPLRDAPPVSHQLLDAKRVAVGSSFALGHGGVYGFKLSAYDHRHPLVIDPGLVYSTYLGGAGSERLDAVAVDGAGSAYVTGGSDSLDFPTTAGAFDRRRGGRGLADVVVVKLNAAGSALDYSTYLGGSRTEGGLGVEVDAAGNAYVGGSTRSTNFPTTPGAYDTSYNTRRDAFITKLNAAGSGLVYSTYLGGNAFDSANGIAVDSAGDVYATGESRSIDFPTTAGAFDTRYEGNVDAFVTKLNSDGSGLVYSTYLGGSANQDYGVSIAVDGAASAYVTGATASPNFPTGAAAFDSSYNGGVDAFVAKLDAAGAGLAYSTFLGGDADDDVGGIAIDSAGASYVTGQTNGDFPTTEGAFDRASDAGASDAFVTKLNSTGSALVYSTYLGGDEDDAGFGVAVDGSGTTYVAGSTTSGSFPTTAGAADRSHNGDSDAFVTRLSADGSGVDYSTYLGGNYYEVALGLAVDAARHTYVVGFTDSNTFATTARAFDRTYNGGTADAFVAKLDLVAAPVRCHVPLVIGMRLAKAARTIRARDCSIGRIRRLRSKRVGRVVGQSPRAGTVRRRGFRVNLTIGRR